MQQCATAVQLALEEQVVDQPKPARGDLGQRRRHLVSRHVGQKSERAQVHAEHRQLVIAHPAGGPQDRAVAAEHDHHVGRRHPVRLEPSLAPLVTRRDPAGDDLVASGCEQPRHPVGLMLHAREPTGPHENAPQPCGGAIRTEA